jgi:hypothetical protein
MHITGNDSIWQLTVRLKWMIHYDNTTYNL